MQLNFRGKILFSDEALHAVAHLKQNFTKKVKLHLVILVILLLTEKI